MYIEYGPLIHMLDAQLARMRAAEAASQPVPPDIGPNNPVVMPSASGAHPGAPRSPHPFQAPQACPVALGGVQDAGRAPSPRPDAARTAASQGYGGMRRPSTGAGSRAQSVLTDMAAMAPGLADKEPFPYLMQVRHHSPVTLLM